MSIRQGCVMQLPTPLLDDLICGGRRETNRRASWDVFLHFWLPTCKLAKLSKPCCKFNIERSESEKCSTVLAVSAARVVIQEAIVPRNTHPYFRFALAAWSDHDDTATSPGIRLHDQVLIRQRKNDNRCMSIQFFFRVWANGTGIAHWYRAKILDIPQLRTGFWQLQRRPLDSCATAHWRWNQLDWSWWEIPKTSEHNVLCRSGSLNK